MKLNDYAKSTRRGREANRMEREAMSDPFLSDAIEGLDAVYANHTDILAQLENRVAKLSKKKRKVRPLPTEMDVLAQPQQIVAEADETCGLPNAAEIAADGGNVDIKDFVAAEEKAGVAEMSGSGQRPPAKPHKRRTALWTGIAAVFVLCAAGTAWWYFDRMPQGRQTHVAQRTVSETNVPEVSGPEFSEEPDAFYEEITDAVLQPAVPAEQTTGTVEKSKAKIEPEPLKSDIKFTPPVIISDEDVKEEDLMQIDELDFTKIVVAEKIVNDQIATRKATDEAAQGISSSVDAEDKKDKKAVLSSPSPDNALSAHALSAQSATESLQEQQSAEPKDRIPVVVNSEFSKYFEENMTVHTDSDGNRIVGKVIAEFRVNSQGIPSGVRIISSPKIDMGREVVQLLVSGPRWTPTNGQRIRAEVEYR